MTSEKGRRRGAPVAEIAGTASDITSIRDHIYRQHHIATFRLNEMVFFSTS